MLGRLRSWVTWSWTYLWAVWFLLVLALVYILRGPLKISESLEQVPLVLPASASLEPQRPPGD